MFSGLITFRSNPQDGTGFETSGKKISHSRNPLAGIHAFVVWFLMCPKEA